LHKKEEIIKLYTVFSTYYAHTHTLYPLMYSVSQILLFKVLLHASVSQTILLTDPFWPQNVTTDPRILAHVHIVYG